MIFTPIVNNLATMRMSTCLHENMLRITAKKSHCVIHRTRIFGLGRTYFPVVYNLRNTRYSSMGWALARMARYIKQSKYLEQLKTNEEVWAASFPSASYLMYSKGRALLTASAVPMRSKINWRTLEEIEPYCPDVRKTSIVLGVDEESNENRALFACDIKPEAAEEVQVKYEGKFTDMRVAIITLNSFDAQLVGRGYTMLTWNDNLKFCSTCASPMKKTFSGTVRTCSKPCDPHKESQYPPINPVAITRVLNHTQDKVLLVRQPRHPKGMYSCIAGFMEPGETLQDCVRREIAEEAGIVVENIQYFQSQTWPLPQSSLMLGCTAIAMPGSEQLDLDPTELEDGGWFTKEEVKAAFDRIKRNPGIVRNNESNELFIPPRGAIAHSLLQNWVEDYTPSQL